MPFSLRAYLPKTLFFRSLLILVSPVVLIHLISGYVFFERHWDYVSHLLSKNIAGEVSSVLRLAGIGLPLPTLQSLAADHYDLQVSVAEVFPPSQPPEGLSGRILEETLSKTLTMPYALQRTHHWLKLWVKTPKQIYYFQLRSKRLAHRTTLLFILWALGSSLVFVIIAVIVMRNQISPLRRLAQWSETLDKGQPSVPLKIEGAREIRKIARGIQLMVQRIRKSFEERNRMLLGISHDLRTPLTRIKLQLQLMPPSEDLQALQQDVEQMIQMINVYLTFAQDAQEPYQTIALKPFINGFVPSSLIITWLIDDTMQAHLQPIQFRRALQNLLDNALRYAHQHVYLKVAFQPKHRCYAITIEDDGPGIPENLYEDIFHPFFRIDSSRPLTGDNVGLGLSIVKSIILSHKGTIKVSRSAWGGAAFHLTLPAG